jgi:hypothetical protein
LPVNKTGQAGGGGSAKREKEPETAGKGKEAWEKRNVHSVWLHYS